MGESGRELSEWRASRRVDRLLLRYAVLTIVVVGILLLTFAWIAQLQNEVRRYDQIRFETQRLLEKQIDQEIGLRGYDATRARIYLQPYFEAQAQFDAIFRSLAVLRLQHEAATLDEIRAQHDRWQELVAAPVLGSPGSPVSARSERLGKTIIDRMRSDAATIEATYSALAASALAETQFYERFCAVVIVCTVGLIAVYAFASERAGARREEAMIVRVMEKRDTAARIGEWRSKVVAMLAHDFKSTLGVVKAYSNMLHDVPDARSDAAIYEGIDRAIDELAAMADEALLMARMAGGALIVARDQLSISQVLETVVSRYRDRRSISLETRDAYVFGDGPYLLRVFDNLVGNAVKYSPDGSPIDLRIAATDGGTVDVTVADRGKGIEPNELPHIFGEYWRSSKEDRSTGTGVGLFIVKKIVEAHSGSIAVRSTSGEGTTVIVTLPRAPTPTLTIVGQT